MKYLVTLKGESIHDFDTREEALEYVKNYTNKTEVDFRYNNYSHQHILILPISEEDLIRIALKSLIKREKERQQDV